MKPLRFPAFALALTLLGCSGNGTFANNTLGNSVATLNTSTLAFGTIPLGQTSAAQNITVTNTGAGAGLTFSTAPRTSGASPAAFLTSSACPVSLAPKASCNISVVYSPTASGAQSATLTLFDNAANNPQMIALSGTGSSSGPVVSLSANTLTFPRIPVGQASTQTVTLTNIGSLALNLAGFTLGGANATSFATSGSCLTTATIAAGGSCFLTVTYSPTVTGTLTAIINVNDNAPNTPQIISLSTT